MAPKVEIDRIWWRNVQPGEFYNIERVPRIAGGGGSLYIEVPSSIVPATLDFLDATGQDVDTLPVITIYATVFGRPDDPGGQIEFHRKAGGRMRIARQNRQQPNSPRHPAWTVARGFPSAPDNVGSKDEAMAYFPDGGLRIYIAKTVDGAYVAGFTKGPRPKQMRLNDPMWELYPEGRAVGGVIDAN
ncbi:hypothetical protein [Janibacter sp. G368]|uniref:hypothetical protein n=1 Tax=Janibacter sp. G368 TaxID=3420441 RepID=UPI003D01A969